MTTHDSEESAAGRLRTSSGRATGRTRPPEEDASFADFINPLPKYVASRTLTQDAGLWLPRQPHQGFGLRGMRDRLAAVGGRLEVASTPDGTRLVAHVPLGGDATPGEAPAEQPAPTEEDR